MSGNAYRRGLFRAGLLIFGAAHRGQRGDAGGVGAQGLSSGTDGDGNPSLKWTFLPNAPMTVNVLPRPGHATLIVWLQHQLMFFIGVVVRLAKCRVRCP